MEYYTLSNESINPATHKKKNKREKCLLMHDASFYIRRKGLLKTHLKRANKITWHVGLQVTDPRFSSCLMMDMSKCSVIEQRYLRLSNLHNHLSFVFLFLLNHYSSAKPPEEFAHHLFSRGYISLKPPPGLMRLILLLFLQTQNRTMYILLLLVILDKYKRKKKP